MYLFDVHKISHNFKYKLSGKQAIDEGPTVTEMLYLIMLKMEGQSYIHCNQNWRIQIGSLEPNIFLTHFVSMINLLMFHLKSF